MASTQGQTKAVLQVASSFEAFDTFIKSQLLELGRLEEKIVVINERRVSGICTAEKKPVHFKVSKNKAVEIGAV